MSPTTDKPHPARARNAEATRTDLLRAAQRRFTVLGYDRTTTRDIAADAGVNVSLINRYFGSKDGLFAAVVRESADTLDDLRATPPVSIVDGMLAGLEPDAWPEFGHEHPLLLLLHDVGTDERVRHLRERTLSAAITHLAERTGSAGSTDSAEDARLRAQLVFALYAGVITLKATLPDEPLATTDTSRLRRELERATDAILAGPS